MAELKEANRAMEAIKEKMAAAKASAEGIRAIKENTHFGVKSLQAHHADISDI